MPIAIISEQICFVRLELSPESDEILELLERHAKKYKNAGEHERSGAEMIKAAFQPDHAVAFISGVVHWGGGYRILPRILERNTPDELAEAVKAAYAFLQDGQAATAVTRLQQLKGLGQSFASKVARFLSPTTSVILDSVIRGQLGYPETQGGYQEFLKDCQATLERLAPTNPELRICDVEAVIFAKIQGY